MGNPITTLQFITHHEFSKYRPLKGICRFLSWQLQAKLTGRPRLFQFTPHSKLWLAPGLRGASGNYYCGLHEFADMAFTLHFLKAGELFVDIGANIGSYSMLAAAECGATVMAFEPVPHTFHWLLKNRDTNRLHQQVRAYNIAIGQQSGNLYMTTHLDAQNHITHEQANNTISVPVQSLDETLQGQVPTLIKLDVEGAEDTVLAGAQKTIAASGLQALIVEMTNKIFPGRAALKCHDWLLQQGFGAYSYEPYTRTLVSLNQPHWHNTIYLRNVQQAAQRLATAPYRLFWDRKL